MNNMQYGIGGVDDTSLTGHSGWIQPGKKHHVHARKLYYRNFQEGNIGRRVEITMPFPWQRNKEGLCAEELATLYFSIASSTGGEGRSEGNF